MKKQLEIAHASGIDALYYFAQSGGFYESYYADIIQQIEEKKRVFASYNYAYQDNEITVTLNDITVKYSGKGRDGFLWFNHEFFRVGFKEEGKNSNINDVRVQLNTVGIYTIGLASLLEYINTVFLKGAILKNSSFPITRIDVNMFVQHNFNYLHKEMIVSKKKNHSANIGERSSGYELETYYVGKKPFLLRIYNKIKELQTASEVKRNLMYNYFGINGMDVKKPIFNVEFEMHREFLTEYGISTIEDAIKRSKSLFELGCSFIKLIDTSSITDKQINSSNRRRADILPIWEYISTHYDNEEFLQVTTPMNKIEKITYRYGLEDAKKSIKKVVKRLLLHLNVPTLLYFHEILKESKEEFASQKAIQKAHEKYALIHKPHVEDNFKAYSDEGLLTFEKSLSASMVGLCPSCEEYTHLSYLYSEVLNELEARELFELPF